MAAVPAGFTDQQVVQGFYNPTSLAFTPDGRVLVTEQPGRLRVVKDNQLLTAPAVSLAVSFTGERGLLSVTIDPDFATNNYVYLYYTTSTGTIHNRVSRFTFSGDTIAPATETVIFDLDPLTGGDIHNAGALHFGADGKLYVATGENGVPAQAQSLNTTLGKILRINKDGSIPNDNPFYNQTTGNNRAIYAYGLRNPFTFAIQPGTGRLFANDVGQERVEEVNDIVPGGNYGWPEQEGPGTNLSYKNPIASYLHSDNNGTCIAGGAFYNPIQVDFPAPYLGQYFFGDYTGGWIRQLDPSTGFVSTFATNISSMIGLALGPDGSLMYLSRGYEYSNTGILSKITYDPQSNEPPSIVKAPADTTVRPGEQAIFSVVAQGSLPITYQWFRDNNPIAGATGPSVTINNAQPADSGAQIKVRITNQFGQITSTPITLSVQNTPVTKPTITQEPADQSAAVGQTVTYSLVASGGSLSYQWYRNGSPVAGATGSSWSPVVTIADNSMAVQCYVTNSAGQAQTKWVQLNLVGSPTLSVPTILTQPASTSAAVGSNAFFSVQATSPVAITYQWYRNGTPITGATGNTLLYAVQSGDTGTRFSVIVTNSAGFVSSTEAVLAVTSPGAPVITQHPASTSVPFGSSATFSVIATGSNLTYQWLRNGVAINGATASSYTFITQIADDTARYSVTVANASGSVTSNQAILTILSQSNSTPVISVQPTEQLAVIGSTASFTIAATGGGLSYQWYRNGVAVNGATGSTWTLTAKIDDTDMAVQCRVSNTIGTTWSSWTKLTLVASASLPVITQGPISQAATVGGQVNFSVTAVGAGLTYQWLRNNVVIPGATGASYSFAATLADNSATYIVKVTNTTGTVTSQPATLSVTSGASAAPVANILTPTATLKWAGNDIISFSGSATDAEDGVLPASAYSWVVIFHHDTHTHPFIPPIDGVTAGTFTVPNSGHTETNVWYQIRLTVTDSSGQTAVATRDIYPQLVNLTIDTNVPGLVLKLDSQPTPGGVVPSIIGLIRTLEAPESQILNGKTYDFIGWSDGQPWASRTLWTPYEDSTFRAMYQLRV